MWCAQRPDLTAWLYKMSDRTGPYSSLGMDNAIGVKEGATVRCCEDVRLNTRIVVPFCDICGEERWVRWSCARVVCETWGALLQCVAGVGCTTMGVHTRARVRRSFGAVVVMVVVVSG